MSNPIVLILAPLTAKQAADWTDRFGRLVDEVSSAEAVIAGVDVWSRSGAFLADEVQDVFWHAMADWSLLNELSNDVKPDTANAVVMVTRKLAPMAVLLTGLGWDRARRLPGFAGLWLLGPEGVRTAASDVEQAFRQSPTDRSSIKDRMAQAALLGDQPDLDLDHLLDMVPNAFAYATERGLGMVSCTAVGG